MNENNLLESIALRFIPGIGDHLARKLVSNLGSAQQVFKEKKALLRRIIKDDLTEKKITEAFIRAEKELRFNTSHKIKTYTFFDHDYPSRLKQCHDAPFILFHKGASDLNAGKIISVVGTRTPSEYGKEITGLLIRELNDEKIVVISGLAYGIDIIAHRYCIENSMKTVAVLGHGLNKLYPAAHRGFAEQIINSGGLLSEFSMDTKPDRENFPKRNRIVAGISDAVLVVEAARNGGALITAEIANSYSREVFALPGKRGDKFSEGCNYLIRENKAALIERGSDIVKMMNWDLEKKRMPSPIKHDLSTDQTKLVQILNEYKEVHIDDISALTKMNIGQLSAKLLELEFMNVIISLPGKRYRVSF